jgi:hypothetical protein
LIVSCCLCLPEFGKIDKVNGNLSDYLNSNSKICKAAIAEWGQLQQY